MEHSLDELELFKSNIRTIIYNEAQTEELRSKFQEKINLIKLQLQSIKLEVIQ